MRTRPARRRRQTLLTAMLAAVVLMAFAVPAAAQPAWRIDSVSNTTAAPGGTLNYLVQVTNVGDDVADGTADPLSFTATMPAGVSATGVTPFFNRGWDCSGTTFGVPGGTVICTDSTDVFGVGVRNFDVLRIATSIDPSAGTGTAHFQVSGGGAPAVTTADPTTITDAAPKFGIDSFDGASTSDTAGDPETQAGAHPFALTTSIDFDTDTNPLPLIGDLWPVEPTKDVVVDLPPGVIGDPTAASQCTESQLANGSGFVSRSLCPPSSQVGTTLVRLNGLTGSSNIVIGPVPVFNLVPPPNAPARFGFDVDGTIVTIDATLRSNSDYGVTARVHDVPEGLAIAGTSLTLWGVPADASHDAQRACPGDIAPWIGGPTCPDSDSPKAFLRNPTSCTAPGVGLPTSLHIDSWDNPGRLDANGAPDLADPNWVSQTITSHDPPGYPLLPADWGPPQGPTGCDNVPFDPALSGTPTAPPVAGAPSGLSFDLTMPQSDDPVSIGESDLKTAVVTLPDGLYVSPSSAQGLGGCTESQIDLHSLADATCPDSSKIGSLTIDTPLLPTPLTGQIYLAQPNQNPFGTLLAVYFVAKGDGVILKLPGKVETSDSGQLTATFDNLPQLPFSKLHAEFSTGPNAPFVLPRTCGTYTTHAVMTGWNGKVVDSDSSFDVSADGHGAPCAASQFSPGFSAGTTNPIAGADSPFLLRLTRSDQDQELSGLTVYMPTGLLGRIKNVTLCGDAAAAGGACGADSQVGSVTVGAGAGPTPFYITAGRAYLTGPYNGAPYGLSIVVPAVAGPFDLGNVVVRAAAFVDRQSAQLKVVSDPLPTILDGIRLDVRDVRVSIDRPHFILNPTSCAEKHVLGKVGSVQRASANVSTRFQVAECERLGLAPKLSLTVGAKHHTQAGVSTPVTATLTMPAGGDANLRSTSVTLPGSLNALLPVVNRACKLTEFEAGHCGNASKVGTAVAITPLLRDPLRGSVYFVKNPKRVLPDLMVALRGQVNLDVTAKVSIPGGKRLGTRFDTIPDAPITKFTLRIVSGKNGPVGIATNLCSVKGRSATAAIGFRGQNGKLLQVNQPVHVNGCPKAGRASKRK